MRCLSFISHDSGLAVWHSLHSNRQKVCRVFVYMEAYNVPVDKCKEDEASLPLGKMSIAPMQYPFREIKHLCQ